MAPLPVHILTGFLGSGKTTLLAALVRQHGFADTAVVVNELGEVGLDHVLVAPGSEDDVVLLESGCLCCALGNSLQETLESLHYRRVRGELPPFARVVVETTGVADPGPLAATLGLDSAIARHYRLGSIVTVVDALYAREQLARFEEARRQVAMADRLVVTKQDLAPSNAAALDAALRSMNPYAVKVSAVRGEIAADAVVVDMLQPRALERYAAHHDCADDVDGHDHAAHDHLAERGIASTSMRLERPLDWPRYAAWVQWLQRAFGERLLRMKGAVRMEDGSAQALHAVMRLFTAPAALPELPAALGNGVVVLITQDADEALIAEARERLCGLQR